MIKVPLLHPTRLGSSFSEAHDDPGSQDSTNRAAIDVHKSNAKVVECTGPYSVTANRVWPVYKLLDALLKRKHHGASVCDPPNALTYPKQPPHRVCLFDKLKSMLSNHLSANTPCSLAHNPLPVY